MMAYTLHDLVLEERYGITVTDAAMHAWTCAADIVATVEREMA